MIRRLWRWLSRAWPSDAVSASWRSDQARREWGSGVDQVSIAWPIDKSKNESATWNRHRLRRKA